MADTPTPEYLRDLAERLMGVPVMYGTDQGDVARLHKIANGPSDADLSAIVAEAIESWKTARQLPYLSPTACKQLNELIVAGLRPVLGGKR